MTKAEQIRALREQKFAHMGDAADIAADLERRLRIAQGPPPDNPEKQPAKASPRPPSPSGPARVERAATVTPLPVAPDLKRGRCKDSERAHSERTTQPWRALGMSRRTYYRRKLQQQQCQDQGKRQQRQHEDDAV